MNDPELQRFVPVSFLYGSVARLLRAAAAVLALLFLLRVLLALGPAAGGPLEASLRLSDALVSQAPIAVLAACLAGLALLIDEDSLSSRRLQRTLQSLAIPVAIGYLLLIPLYGVARWNRSRVEADNLRTGLRSSLVQLRGARQQVLRASSNADLERILERLPEGSPPLARFGADLPRRRSTMVGFLDQVQRILTMRLQGMEQRMLASFLRETTLFSLACLGMAALFYRSSQLDFGMRRPWRIRPNKLRRPRRRWGTVGELDRETEQLIRQSGAWGGSDENTASPETGGQPPRRQP